MEGKLTSLPRLALCAFLVLILGFASLPLASGGGAGDVNKSFTIVVYICVWKRPLLTQFVLNHFKSLSEQLRPSGTLVELFVVGSDNSTKQLADSVSAPFAIHDNHPVGRKHHLGLLSLRDHYEQQVRSGVRAHVPDAVTVFGSDDVVTAAYFTAVRDALKPRWCHAVRAHVFALRDVWFHDLRSRRLVYTTGYRSGETPLARSVGCGRSFSWALLAAVRWQLWDVRREHGLDQSAVRNVMRRAAFVSEVSRAVIGRDQQVAAVDIKTDGFAKTGSNLWAFDTIVAAGDGAGRLARFTEEKADTSLGHMFGADFVQRLEQLRRDMMRVEQE